MRPRVVTTAKVLGFLAVLLAIQVASAEEWTPLASLPDREGFGGSFAGVSNGVLLVAGGANFPAAKPWEGGTKKWHDTIFALEKPKGEWKLVGRLPRPLGYGVSATHAGSMVCVGGSDAERHYCEAFRITWNDGQVVTTPLPMFPRPIANACGAMVGEVLYVVGGLESPDAKTTLKSFCRIDLSAAEPRWENLDDCPGSGRMLAMAAGQDGAFWLFGGVDLQGKPDGTTERRYLKDAYRYDVNRGWRRIADLPYPLAASPSPAPTMDRHIYLLGGDDGTQVQRSPSNHRGFSAEILRYAVLDNRWIVAGKVMAPRVTVPCVSWNERWIIPSGEMRPGIRSAEVWGWAPKNNVEVERR